MAEVFVSYRHISPDQDLARELAVYLSRQGVSYFIDSRLRSSVAMKKRARILVVTLALGFLPFILIMSLLLADVEIRTDKEFYRPDDEVLVSARRAGYIFQPHINEIEFGHRIVELNGEGTVAFASKDHSGGDLIIVRFTPQLLWTQRNAYHFVRMAK